MTVSRRLAKLDKSLPPDPNRPPRFLVVAEDADGRWWEWDSEPRREIDSATVHPRTLVVIIGERPDEPQQRSSSSSDSTRNRRMPE